MVIFFEKKVLRREHYLQQNILVLTLFLCSVKKAAYKKRSVRKIVG